jgi:hypothetical protein
MAVRERTPNSNYLALDVYQLMEAREGRCLGGSVTVYVYSGLVELDSSVQSPVKCPSLSSRSFLWEKLTFSKPTGKHPFLHIIGNVLRPDEEDQDTAGLLLRTYSAGPVSPICFDV